MNKVRLSILFKKQSGINLPPLLPAIILVGFIIMALFAPLLAPYPETEGDLKISLSAPSLQDHFLGTDRFGRDIFSRIFYGARVSMLVALLSIFISGTIGTIIGALSGYLGGWKDTILMRLTDMGLSLPLILLAIIIAVLLGASMQTVIVVLGLLLWPRFARQIRAEALVVREQDFVALARVAGLSNWTIVRKHILPNVVPTLLVLSTFQASHVILTEASLSFLGVGIPPPQASLGLMVAEGRGLLRTAWWISLFPGLALLFLSISLNIVGDWLRDRLDPKLRQI